MAKKILITVGVVVALLIIVAVALPFFIDANRFKPTLETDLSNALGRKVDIGNISLSILSGSVSVDRVSIADDPAFSHAPFLTAKQLSAGVSLMPLIFSKRLDVSSFMVTDPQVTLLRAPSGRWNYSSLGASTPKLQGAPKTEESKPQESKAPEQTPGSSGATNFSVAKLQISNGTITVGAVGTSKTRIYQNVDLDASDLSYTAQFPFQITAKTPGGGNIKVEGKAGPVNQSDASLTPFNGTISVESLDLAATGFVEASSGIGGMVDFHGDIGSNGREMTSKGTLKAAKITLVPHSTAATVPVNLDYATTYDLTRNTGTLNQGEIRIGKAVADLGGTYDAAGTTTTLQMKMVGKGMPVPDLEGVLPAVGVTLPSGAKLETGTLDATLSISGPVEKLVIAGPVNLSNAKLTGFNLKGKLGALASFGGLGGGGSSSDTEIQTLSANVHVDPAGTQAQNLNLVVPSLGAITGNGNVSSTGQLNFKMVAKLGANNAAGAMTSALSAFTGGNSGGGIPFKITGTTSAPVFLPDVGGMVGGMTKGAAGQNNPANAASSMLGGLLKKKQPKQ
jgi:AsmA protein